MRALIVVAVALASLLVSTVWAQDVEQEEGDAQEAVEERPAPEVVEAWALPEEEAARAADHDGNESTAWVHIHDVDADLLEREAAERMIGFDVLDGAR